MVISVKIRMSVYFRESVSLIVGVRIWLRVKIRASVMVKVNRRLGLGKVQSQV